MGRFSHEAMMVDPATGNVYETEDADALRLLQVRADRPGKLVEGGELYMLRVEEPSRTSTSARLPTSARPGTSSGCRSTIRDATSQSTFAQGAAPRAARVPPPRRRVVGRSTRATSSRPTAAPAGEGQVFEYDPIAETVKLIYDSPSRDECDNPDNITVTPRGGLLLCEDAAGDDQRAASG